MSAGWVPVADGLPDDAETVLIHSPRSNEPVWLGYWDSAIKQWHYVEGPVARGVTHWAAMPDAPGA